MVPSPAKPIMVVEEATDMEEDVVEDIMVEGIMGTEEVPMAVVEVIHPWAEVPEAAAVGIILLSGRITIAAWA